MQNTLMVLKEKFIGDAEGNENVVREQQQLIHNIH